MAVKEDICIVVDDLDQVIEYKKRSTLSLDQRWRDTGIILTNDRGEVLLAQRHKNKTHMPSLWATTAAGTVESHESYEENAYKELEEEVGVTGVKLTYHGNYVVSYGEHRRVTGLFTGSFNGNISKLPLEENEVSALKWMSVDELVKDMRSNPEHYTPGLIYTLVATGLVSDHEIEFVQAVDAGDSILCYKDRKQTDMDTYRITVVWIEDGEGNVLIHKRSMSKKHGGGRWENAAGGVVNHTETPEENAYKELEEEIGVTGIDLQYVDKTVVHTSHGDRMCYWYRGLLDRDDWPESRFTLEESAVDAVKWVDKQELFDSRDKQPEDYMPSSAFWRELF